MNKKLLLLGWLLTIINPVCIIIFLFTRNELCWLIGMSASAIAIVFWTVVLVMQSTTVVTLTRNTPKTEEESKAPKKSYMLLPFLNYSVAENGQKELYLGWWTEIYFIYWNEPK